MVYCGTPQLHSGAKKKLETRAYEGQQLKQKTSHFVHHYIMILKTMILFKVQESNITKRTARFKNLFKLSKHGDYTVHAQPN